MADPALTVAPTSAGLNRSTAHCSNRSRRCGLFSPRRHRTRSRTQPSTVHSGPVPCAAPGTVPEVLSEVSLRDVATDFEAICAVQPSGPYQSLPFRRLVGRMFTHEVARLFEAA